MASGFKGVALETLGVAVESSMPNRSRILNSTLADRTFKSAFFIPATPRTWNVLVFP